MTDERGMADQREMADERATADQRGVAGGREMADQREMGGERGTVGQRGMAGQREMTDQGEVADQRRMADQREVVDERGTADQRGVAGGRRMADQREIVDERGTAGQRQVAGQRAMAGEGEMAGQGRIADQRRPLWIVTALLLGASAALWGSSRLPWAGDAPAALVPLALLALAGIAGVLATSGWARRAVGVVIVLAGVAASWTGVDGGFGHGFWARLVALLAALALVVAGVVLVRSGHRMPKLGGSYQTPAAARGSETPDKELWRALSEGQDPTVE